MTGLGTPGGRGRGAFQERGNVFLSVLKQWWGNKCLTLKRTLASV